MVLYSAEVKGIEVSKIPPGISKPLTHSLSLSLCQIYRFSRGFSREAEGGERQGKRQKMEEVLSISSWGFVSGVAYPQR